MEIIRSFLLKPDSNIYVIIILIVYIQMRGPPKGTTTNTNTKPVGTKPNTTTGQKPHDPKHLPR